MKPMLETTRPRTPVRLLRMVEQAPRHGISLAASYTLRLIRVSAGAWTPTRHVEHVPGDVPRSVRGVLSLMEQAGWVESRVQGERIKLWRPTLYGLKQLEHERPRMTGRDLDTYERGCIRAGLRDGS